MPMIDSLTNPQRRALDQIRAGKVLDSVTMGTLKALTKRGIITPTGDGDRIRLTDVGEALYIEDEMRANKVFQFKPDQPVKVIEWITPNGVWRVIWRPARVVEVLDATLLLRYEPTGKTHYRYPRSVRHLTTQELQWASEQAHQRVETLKAQMTERVNNDEEPLISNYMEMLAGISDAQAEEIEALRWERERAEAALANALRFIWYTGFPEDPSDPQKVACIVMDEIEHEHGYGVTDGKMYKTGETQHDR